MTINKFDVNVFWCADCRIDWERPEGSIEYECPNCRRVVKALDHWCIHCENACIPCGDEDYYCWYCADNVMTEVV